jgi:hypothetical protein
VRRALTASVLLLVLAGCNDDSSPTPDPTVASIDGVQTFTGLSQKHLGKGEYDVTYPQSPPVGGAHSPVWLKCQVYTSELPKVNAVHSLEHGGVWITYLPDAKADVIAALDQYQGLNKEYVFISPYAGQSSPIVVTAWGRQLGVTDAADPRIAEFVRAYAGNGPEKGVTCASSGATLEQALQYDQSQQ